MAGYEVNERFEDESYFERLNAPASLVEEAQQRVSLTSPSGGARIRPEVRVNDAKRLVLRCVILAALMVPSLLFAKKTVIFVVDVSGSMPRGGLFERVRNTLITYVQTRCDTDDRVSLMSFGTDVGWHEEVVIRSAEDKTRVITEVGELKAKDQWTWMTKAFKLIGERLRELNASDPSTPKDIYIFTDGKNEPPPGQEDAYTFRQILREHFSDYQPESLNVYTYYISLGAVPPKETKDFLDSIRARTSVTDRGTPEVPGLVEFKIPPRVGHPIADDVEIPLRLQIIRFERTKGDNVVNIRLKQAPGGIDVRLQGDTSFVCTERGQVANLLLVVADAKVGLRFKQAMILESPNTGLDVRPREHTVDVSITKKPTPPWVCLLAVLGLLLVSLTVTAGLASIPKFPKDVYLSVLDEGGNVLNRYSLKSRQKFANSRLNVSGDLSVRGVARDCFVLAVDKGGAVSIRANSKQSPISMVSAAMDLEPGRVYALTPGDEFTVSGVKLRYGKGV